MNFWAQNGIWGTNQKYTGLGFRHCTTITIYMLGDDGVCSLGGSDFMLSFSQGQKRSKRVAKHVGQKTTSEYVISPH